MSPILGVAAGHRAVRSLKPTPEARDVSLVSHGDLLVRWDRDNPWISSYDDGGVVVVLDGRLHDRRYSPAVQAKHVVDLYHARGAQFAQGLLGDYVIVILDRNRSRLLVSRDPLGVRPWYQATSGDDHAGASDLGSLADLPWVDTAVDETMAIRYLAVVVESRGDTLRRGITTLSPATTWDHSKGRTDVLRHHTWDAVPVRPRMAWNDAVLLCRELLEEAVRDRVVDSEPVTCELSGGLDSSSIVGTAMLLSEADVLTGRIVFDGPVADERAYSDAVARHWNIPLISADPWMPTPATLAGLSDQWHRPPPDPHFTMTLNLHDEMTARGRPLSISGLGGDDAFIAMPIGSRLVSAFQLRQGRVLAGLAGQAVRHPRTTWDRVARPASHYLRPSRGPEPPAWVSPAAAERAGLLEHGRRHADPVTGVDAVDARLGGITSGYAASILEDRAVICDLAGRRETHPFLDPRFIAGVYGLNPWWPLRGGHYRALQAAAYADRLPAVVAQRRTKAEFSEVFWPQLLSPAAVDSVMDGPLIESGWLVGDVFQRLVQYAREGQAHAALPLTRCISLDRWLRANG